MDKSEAKYHNAALKMHNALIQLLEKKEFEGISVTELCAQAQVNRSTFYAHYANTRELLKETYAERLQQLFRSFSRSLTDIRRFDREESIFISPEYLLPYLEFVQENQHFFKVYMNRLSSFDVEETYSFLLEQVFLPICEKNGMTDKTAVTYLSKFFLQGVTAIVLEWANRGCADDPLFICELIILCVRPYIKN